MNDISPYIDHHARHNLLFVQGKIDGICHVDIGKVLSRRIEGKLTLRQLPMICDDALSTPKKGDHIQESLLLEDEMLLQYYDNAAERSGME